MRRGVAWCLVLLSSPAVAATHKLDVSISLARNIDMIGGKSAVAPFQIGPGDQVHLTITFANDDPFVFGPWPYVALSAFLGPVTGPLSYDFSWSLIDPDGDIDRASDSGTAIANVQYDDGIYAGAIGGHIASLGVGPVAKYGSFRGVTIDYVVRSGQTSISNVAVEIGGHGIPEPATWAMLIAGFGLVGASIRGRAGERRLVRARGNGSRGSRLSAIDGLRPQRRWDGFQRSGERGCGL